MTMNRTQDTIGISLQDLQAMGAKPQKMTSKKVIAYRPNWCSPGLIGVENDNAQYVRQVKQYGMKPQYAWLACPNTYSPDVASL